MNAMKALRLRASPARRRCHFSAAIAASTAASTDAPAPGVITVRAPVILESFGRMFKNDLKLYVYPQQEQKNGALITAGNMRVAPHLSHLYAYLHENRYIEALKDFDEKCLTILSRDALAKIKSGDASWEEMVPAEVSAIIKERRLLGCQPQA